MDGSGGLAQIFMTLRPALARFLAARGASGDEAEDVLQDMFLKLGGAAAPVGPIAQPKAYLYRMADNFWLDRRRAAMRRSRREEIWTGLQSGAVDESPSAEHVLIAREQVAEVTRTLAALPERTSSVFRLFRLEGRSQKEIAAGLGISVSAVEKHLQRAYRAVVEVRTRLDAGILSPRRPDEAKEKKALDGR